MFSKNNFQVDSHHGSSTKIKNFAIINNASINLDEERLAVSWINLYLPEKARPYAHLVRLDKQIGTWLVAWPSLWSAALAAYPGKLPDMKILALLGLIAFISRGLGCTINDYFDRDIDPKVERTKLRPLASGALTPFQGLSFLCFQFVLGCALLLHLNNFSRLLWISCMPWIFTYPLMKRISYWPQAYLGFTINLGTFYGWSAIQDNLISSVVFPLYLSGVFWTLVYDTIYAHQDKKDDLKVGVKSTALLFGDSTKGWTTAFGLACIGSFALTGLNANIGWPYYVFLAVCFVQLAWQIWTVNLSNPTDCGRKFKSNQFFGATMFTGILLGRLFS